MWPPSSTDLNLLDFWVWSAAEAVACRKRQSNVKAVEEAIKKAWDEVLVPQKVKRVGEAIHAVWRKFSSQRASTSCSSTIVG